MFQDKGKKRPMYLCSMYVCMYVVRVIGRIFDSLAISNLGQFSLNFGYFLQERIRIKFDKNGLG
jgi:hypothetical protein